MKPALSTPADLHRALRFIDTAVGNGKWAEARKWIRVVVPAIEDLSANKGATQEWLDMARSGAELGRLLVREERRAYPAQMADLVARLNKASAGLI